MQAVTKAHSEWDEVYVDAAAKLISGGDIYGPGSGFLYPPLPAFLAIPFTFVSQFWQRLLWFAINAACLIFTFRWSWLLAGGRGTAPSLRATIAPCLACVIAGTYALNALAHQQTDIVIAFCIVGGALALSRERDVLSGAALGFAAAFKATPLLWLFYLLWRRRFVAALVFVVVAALLTLLADLVAPAPGGSLWVWRWLTRFVIPSQSPDSPVGSWGSSILYNQSLGGLLQRLFNLTMAGGDTAAPRGDGPLVSAVILRIAVLALLAACALGAVLAGTISRRRGDRPREADALEYGLVVILMLLASPMSSPAHFVVLVIPALALACYAARVGSALAWTMLGLAALLSLFANKDLGGAYFYTHLLWYGGPTWSTLALGIGSIGALTARTSSAAPDVRAALGRSTP